MPGNYETTKPAIGDHVPENAVASEIANCVPMLTPQQLRNDFLWGIPLVSYLTQQQMTDENLNSQIDHAVAELEQELHMNIFPRQIQERQAFDQNEYRTMGYMRLRQKPVSSVEKLRIVTSNDQPLWEVSLDWLDRGYMHQGLLYIVPINVAVAPSSSNGGAAGGAAFLAILGQQSWVPAYWEVLYTTGWPQGRFPKQLNNLIGCTAAINILNLLAAASARSTGKSLGIGGLSQSSSGPGPQMYAVAVDALEKRKEKAIRAYRALLGTTWIVGNI